MRSINIKNTGNGPLDLSMLAVTFDGADKAWFSVADRDNTSSLAPGAETTVVVRAARTDDKTKAGVYNADLVIKHVHDVEARIALTLEIKPVNFTLSLAAAADNVFDMYWGEDPAGHEITLTIKNTSTREHLKVTDVLPDLTYAFANSRFEIAAGSFSADTAAANGGTVTFIIRPTAAAANTVRAAAVPPLFC